ncbi:MAG: phosphatidate cytidylyltransferase [Pseudonocardia sp.]|nr:phosphatidate cytidylyltransferase [Pseudonocardia sp.]
MAASPDVPAQGLHPREPAPTAPTDLAPQAAPVARRPPRAGRNLGSAIAVGLALGAIILVPLLTGRQSFVAVLAAAPAVATRELRDALRRRAGIDVPFAATALGCLVWRMRAGAAHYLRDISAALFTAVYVPLFCSFAAMLTVAPDGLGRVLTFMLCVVASDVGGYAIGVLVGRHPMAPSISPKKSWEGFAGSVIAGMVTGVLTVTLLLDGPWWAGVLTGALLVSSATLGDLVESLVKRDLGIKDMGRLLPGHGGLMDRLDSMLPTAVVAYFVLGLLIPAA